MTYFSECKKMDEAKNLFRKLCKELHPDLGGKDKDFIKMFNEFKAFKPSEPNKNDIDFDADEFYNNLRKFDNLVNLKVTFVGTFIWVEDIVKNDNYKLNQTFLQKDEIKSIIIDGYKKPFFSKKRGVWMFAPIGYRKKSNKYLTAKQLKETFKTKEFKTKEKLTLAS